YGVVGELAIDQGGDVGLLRDVAVRDEPVLGLDQVANVQATVGIDVVRHHAAEDRHVAYGRVAGQDSRDVVAGAVAGERVHVVADAAQVGDHPAAARLRLGAGEVGRVEDEGALLVGV